MMSMTRNFALLIPTAGALAQLALVAFRKSGHAATVLRAPCVSNSNRRGA